MLLAKNKKIKKNFSFKFFFYIPACILLLLIVLIYNENKILSFVKKDIILSSKIKDLGVAGLSKKINTKKKVLQSHQ